MDFDVAKENIQPLAAGRDASILQATLCAESPHELQLQRLQMEDAIHNYDGADPLEPWFAYISWLEQSFPSGGKESGLREVMSKCLLRFETDERYFQDRRMVKLLIKHIDNMKDPTECYQQLYNAGIGTMVADFYISWAYYYDISGNARKADEIFRRGIACRAVPLEELQEAHQHFGFTVAQRLIYQDDEVAKSNANQQLQERRLALTSLRGQRHKATVGSLRTGAVVKSYKPGTVNLKSSTSSGRNSAQVPVFNDENGMRIDEIGAASEESVPKLVSAIRSLVDSARNQENEKEPGPWNNAHDKKRSGKLFSGKRRPKGLCFNIHADDESDQEDAIYKKPLNPPIQIGVEFFNKPFIYPETFYTSNKPQFAWITPVTIENEPDVNTLPRYNKCMLYPRPNMEFSPEELCAYQRLNRHGIVNEFTEKMDRLWSKHDITAGVRQYPNFAKFSRRQVYDVLDEYFEPAKLAGLIVPFDKLYDSNQKEEFSIEELYAQKIQRNATITECTDMEETIVMPSENVQRRKSFFPTRLSIAPKAMLQCVVVDGLNEKEKVPQLNKMKLDERKFAEEQVSPKSHSNYANKSTEMDLRMVDANGKKLLKNEILSPIKRKADFLTDFKNGMLGPTDSNKTATGENKGKQTLTKPTLAFEICQDTTKENVNTVGTNVVDQPSSFGYEMPAATKKKEGAKNFEAIEQDNLNNSKVLSVEQELKTFHPFGIYEDTTQIVHSADKDNVVQPAIFSFKVPITQSIEEKENKKIHPENHENNPEVGVVTSEKELKPTKPSLPFEIYEDTTIINSLMYNKNHSEIPHNFHFKAPVVPNPITAKSTQSPFENHAGGPLGPRHGQLFDADETCSTQMFNNFLKSKPMSTPKAPVKFRRRQFGTVLTEPEPVVAPVQIDETEDDLKISPIPAHHLRDGCGDIDVTGAQAGTGTNAPLSYSPGLPKQLSTILETSEHGSTHGTHTTGASTKSTVSLSPEIGITIPRRELETVEEQPSELSLSKIDNNSKVLSQHEPVTPVIPRFHNTADTNLPGIGNYTKPHLQVGNFTRLEESEDTTGAYAHLPSIRFQDDKTDTVPKIPPSKFQDDNTETISKILFQDNKTGTIPKKLLSNPKPPLTRTDAMDDSFDFLIKTPPQAEKSKLKHLSQHSLFQSNSRNLHLEDVIFSPISQQDGLMDSKSFDKRTNECLRNVTKNDSMGLKNITFPKNESIDLGNRTKNDSISFKNLAFPKNDSSVLKNITKNDSMGFVKPVLVKNESCGTINNAKNEALSFKSFSSLKNETHTKVESCLTNEPVTKGKQNDSKSLAKDVSMGFTKFPVSSEACENLANDESMGLENLTSPSFLSDSKVSSYNPSITDAERYKEKLKFPFIEENKALKMAQKKPDFEKLFQQNVVQPKPASEPYFELNAETEMFAPNLSVIKNSTWLHSHDPVESRSKLEEKKSSEEKSMTAQVEASCVQPRENSGILVASSFGNSTRNAELQNKSQNYLSSLPTLQGNMLEIDEMSIYYKKTPRTPKITLDVWHTSSESDSDSFVPPEIDADTTQQIIEHSFVNPNVNPFNAELINAFLYNIDFTEFLQNLSTCQFIRKVPSLVRADKIQVHDNEFAIMKPLGQGAYGAVFSGLNKKTGQKCALKQERPPNYWEYYICLEVQSRIKAEEMLPAFMSIDYALIGQNASILISSMSTYGSLITVCNKVKKYSNKIVDEYVVMYLTCELLEIVDHLHAVGIIHADIKADNFLVMRRLNYESKDRVLQLIDFGVSIDLQQFKPGQTFSYVSSDDAFKCVEMREGRSWSYQLDLYGLAGVIHALLFGKYMEIEKRGCIWHHKTYVPRYFRKHLWDNIFQALLNVRDQKSMPNLQYLRSLLKTELAKKEGYVIRKIAEFNSALN